MNEFKTKLSEDGRIVIPAACRKLLHLKTGDDLILRVENNELHMLTVKDSLLKDK